MIPAAGLLVLLALGLFVAGVVTGATALYWACVAACVAAAGLLFVVRRRIAAAASSGPPAAPVDVPAAASGGGSRRPSAAEPGSAGAASVTTPAPGLLRLSEDLPDPPVEEVEVTDLLLVVDLTDEVLVVDERPRYHLAGCAHVSGRRTIPLPVDEARRDGFTPCATCEPDRNLAERARDRRSARGA